MDRSVYDTDVMLPLDCRDFRAVRQLSRHKAFRILPDDLPFDTQLAPDSAPSADRRARVFAPATYVGAVWRAGLTRPAKRFEGQTSRGFESRGLHHCAGICSSGDRPSGSEIAPEGHDG